MSSGLVLAVFKGLRQYAMYLFSSVLGVFFVADCGKIHYIETLQVGEISCLKKREIGRTHLLLRLSLDDTLVTKTLRKLCCEEMFLTVGISGEEV